MNKPRKWQIDVSSGSYYQSFARNFSSHDLSFAYEHDDHTGPVEYAFCRSIDHLDDYQKISNRLATLQLLLNGILRFTSGRPDFFPTELLSYAPIDSQSNYQRINAENLEDNPFDGSLAEDAFPNRYKGEKIDLDSYLFFLSRSDEKLRHLFVLIGLISTNSFESRILTWNNLYKLLDSIKSYSSEYEWKIDDFADPDEIKAFTGSCNNVSVVGFNARHGQMGWGTPKKTMDLSQSINLIFNTTRKFIERYLEEKKA